MRSCGYCFYCAKASFIQGAESALLQETGGSAPLGGSLTKTEPEIHLTGGYNRCIIMIPAITVISLYEVHSALMLIRHIHAVLTFICLLHKLTTGLLQYADRLFPGLCYADQRFPASVLRYV